jgi:hypothetical protein
MPLRIAFQDEARNGRVIDPRRCLAPRPAAPAQMVREYAYVFGAVSPADGCHDSPVLSWEDIEAMSMFLKEVAKRHKGECILMFMDRVIWHSSGRLKVPSNMGLAFPPPYSPDLNPQEQVWDELREKSIANRLFKSLDAVVDAAVGGLRRIEASPGAVARLMGRDWIEPAPGSANS